MNLSARSYQPELLDRDDIPFEDIRQNMKELDTINTLLGGHQITIRGFKRLARGKRKVSVCEIGCGGGDNLVAISRWCRKENIELEAIGIDIKEACIGFARSRNRLPGARWIVSDYRKVRFSIKPDIIFSSLFVHHFDEPAIVEQLQWMKDNARIGFFINDLHRHTIAYHAIKLLTKCFSRSYLVKNDAPLSVARGLQKPEWLSLLRAAGLADTKVKWQWAFRFLIIYTHAAADEI